MHEIHLVVKSTNEKKKTDLFDLHVALTTRQELALILSRKRMCASTVPQEVLAHSTVLGYPTISTSTGTRSLIGNQKDTNYYFKENYSLVCIFLSQKSSSLGTFILRLNLHYFIIISHTTNISNEAMVEKPVKIIKTYRVFFIH